VSEVRVLEENGFIVGIKTASIELNLRRGYSPKDVRAVQEFLRTLKVLHKEAPKKETGVVYVTQK
tara:strand:- start:263 stop:457 length:195 start_codon:yes stop_codon:yes gene_type:complete